MMFRCQREKGKTKPFCSDADDTETHSLLTPSFSLTSVCVCTRLQLVYDHKLQTMMFSKLILFGLIHIATAWVPASLISHRPRLASASSRFDFKKCCHRERIFARQVHRSPFTETESQGKRAWNPWSSNSTEDEPLGYIKSSQHTSHDRDSAGSPQLVAAGAIAAFLAIIAGIAMVTSFDITPSSIVDSASNIMDDPSAALERVVQSVNDMGPLGPLYFGAAYTLAEILAIPAIPLTASAGYLFGPVQGTGVVLLSASIAASISFVIGRTLLRSYVEGLLEEYPDFAKIDRAIGKEGFKLMLLLRLSPLFPFALSNYLYGASSINFTNFFWGTLLGFTPGTVAYVYTGYVGQALTSGGSEVYPWYFYAGGLTLFAGLLKVVADTATQIIQELDEEEETL